MPAYPGALVDALLTMLAMLGFGLFVASAIWLGSWLLYPVNRAAGHLNAPTRFMLTDFIWLMIQLQLVLGFVMNWIEGATSANWLLVLIFLLSLPVVVMWGASVSVVSRAGITQPLRRAVLILVLVPGSLAVIVAGPVLIVSGIAALNDLSYTRLDRAMLSIGIWLGAAVLTIAFAFILRRLSFWVLTGRAGLVLPDQAKEHAETAG